MSLELTAGRFANGIDRVESKLTSVGEQEKANKLSGIVVMNSSVFLFVASPSVGAE